MSLIVEAAQNLLTLEALALVLAGAAIGIIGGALPGVSASVTMALIFPVTIHMEAIDALILLGSVYMAVEFGGAISAILINAPGTAAAICTALDGYPMSRAGRPRDAVYWALAASGIGGIFGAIMLTAATPPLAYVALRFGAVETMLVSITGLLLVASLSREDMLKGIVAASFGLIIASVGIDPTSGYARLTFNIYQLEAGLALVPIILGIFALAEIVTWNSGAGWKLPKASNGGAAFPRFLWRVICKPVLVARSSVIGVLVGILPGAGASIASFVSYAEAKRRAGTNARFGEGEPDGIVASESANNAMVGGSLVPLLSLGIPGSPSAAILFGILTVHNIIPGARLFADSGAFVYTFMLSLIPAALAMMLVGAVFAMPISHLLRVGPQLIGVGVLCLVLAGAYVFRGGSYDLVTMTAFGLVGLAMRYFGYPVAPFILGIVLGPIVEESMRRSLTLARVAGSWTEFIVMRPIALILVIMLALILLVPLLKAGRKTMQRTSMS